MSWMRIEAGTKDHPKILKLAKDCHVSVQHALGNVLSLWLWVLIHAPDGNLSSYDWEDIELAAGWEGEPRQWYDSAVARRLIDVDGDHAQIHDWADYTSSWTEAIRARDYRESKPKRAARKRDNAAQCLHGAPDGRTDGRTNHRESKRTLSCPTPTEFMDFWNSQETLPGIVAMNKDRSTKLKTRSQDPGFCGRWREIIEKLSQSPWHTGQNDRGWQAGVDWILKNETNWAKILELSDPTDLPHQMPDFTPPTQEQLDYLESELAKSRLEKANAKKKNAID